MKKVEVSPYFQREALRLEKKYRRIFADIMLLAKQLIGGETPGDRVQEVTPFVVYKARVKNSDARKGKSGGYRVIYYIKTEERIILLTIYPKSELADISADEIRQIITESGALSPDLSA